MTRQLLFAVEPVYARLEPRRSTLARAGVELRPLRLEGALPIAGGCVAATPGQLVRARLSVNGAAPLIALAQHHPMRGGALRTTPYGSHFLADGWLFEDAAPLDFARVLDEATRRSASRCSTAALLSSIAPGSLDGLLVAAHRAPGFNCDVTVQLVTNTPEGLRIRTLGGEMHRAAASLGQRVFRGECVLPARALAGFPLPAWATVVWVLPMPAHAGEPTAFIAPARSRVHLAQHAATLRALASAFDPDSDAASFSTSPPRAGSVDDTARPTKPRLLVVDDDEFLREALTEVLEARYDVHTAVDVRSAKEVVEAHPPEAVLADLGLPDADGRSLVSWLATHANLPDIPILVLSGSFEREDRLRAFEVGATDYITKPFDLDELLARLERSLRVSRRLRQLREQAQTDPLTGLGNRRAFEARAREEAERAARYGFPLSVVAVDVDELKRTNDELGHSAGDLVIVLAARILARELRCTDLAARTGGDEFLVLLPHAGPEEALRLGERLLAAARRENGPGRRPLSLSIGIAALDPQEPIEHTVERADEALREAKRSGRGQVCLSGANEHAAHA